MMGQPKALASLSSGLLARKGQAKPAMRPQGFGGFGNAPATDDLGWNDMGQVPVETPHMQAADAAATIEAPVPAVLAEREVLTERIEAPLAVHSVSLATAARVGRESAKLTAKGKAAFTLRLGSDPHLRLRLASAVTNRSAQQLVAEALDHFLGTLPEVEALVAQLPPARKR